MHCLIKDVRCYEGVLEQHQIKYIMNSRKELKWRQKYNFKNSLKNIIDFYDLTQSKISSKDFKKFI